MTKPNSAEFGYFYACCPIIWTLFQFLFTIDKNYDTLTSKGDTATGGSTLFQATGTCNNRNLQSFPLQISKIIGRRFYDSSESNILGDVSAL